MADTSIGVGTTDLGMSDLISLMPNINPEYLNQLQQEGWKFVSYDAPSLLNYVPGAGVHTTGNTDFKNKVISLAGQAAGLQGIATHEIVHGVQGGLPAQSIPQIFANAPQRAQTLDNTVSQLGAFALAGFSAEKLGEQVEEYPYMTAGNADAGIYKDTVSPEFTKLFPDLLMSEQRSTERSRVTNALGNRPITPAPDKPISFLRTSSPLKAPKRSRYKPPSFKKSKPKTFKRPRTRTRGMGGLSEF